MPQRPVEHDASFHLGFEEIIPTLTDGELKLVIFTLFGFNFADIVKGWHKDVSNQALTYTYRTLIKRIEDGEERRVYPAGYELSDAAELFDRQRGEQSDLTADSTAPSWVWTLTDGQLEAYMAGELTDPAQTVETFVESRLCTECGQTKPLTPEFWYRHSNGHGLRLKCCRKCWNAVRVNPNPRKVSTV